MMDADVALLQEAGEPPADVADRLGIGGTEHWDSQYWNSRWYEGRFPKLYDRWTMVVKLSDRVDVEWFKQVSPIYEPAADEFPVSGIGRSCRTCHASGCATVHCRVDVCAMDEAPSIHQQQMGYRLPGRLGAPHHL